MNDEWFATVGSLIGVILVLVVVLAIGSCSCSSKAAKQGMECSWGPLQGCMVRMPDGSWIDYDRLRYMD